MFYKEKGEVAGFIQVCPDPPNLRDTVLLCDSHSRLCIATKRLVSPKLLSGAIAQLGERLPCTQEVSGSIPLGSTIFLSEARSSAGERLPLHQGVAPDFDLQALPSNSP